MIAEEIQDVSTSALEFAVTTGIVDLKSLKIFCEQKIEIADGYYLHAAIIGTSHFIQLRKEAFCFTEMLACDANGEYGGEKLILKPILSVTDGFEYSCANLDYSFSSEVKEYSSNYKDLTETWNQKKMHDPLIHMEFEFNKNSNLPSARTLLSVKKDNSKLCIFTAHEYQEENKVVLTKSLISIHG